MAAADYKTCSHCGAKTYYDAEVNYQKDISVAALCSECNKYIELTARRKKSKREVKLPYLEY